ncbi:unnamed protein product [Peniophora sp. CBMAI 1063]|nr:unnamed protein product [Peniophora sp. CBMAI 1063]
MKTFVIATALVVLASALCCSAYIVPSGSPGFYAGNSTSAVTFDQHSVFLDGKRVFVFSGEMHPWRAPSGGPTWRDVLQKMKAAGFNAVSVYHRWGSSSGRQGQLDFEYWRNQTEVYQIAKEVGILVIARPGPYINAETSAGGYPGWATLLNVTTRSNASEFTDAWMPYIAASAQFIAPYQYPDGPVIAVQVENEFGLSDPEHPGRSEYFAIIEDALRSNGITKVPLTSNEAGDSGLFAPEPRTYDVGAVDLYTFDAYPQRYACNDPYTWHEVVTSYPAAHAADDPDLVWASGEYQAGSQDGWGGGGYDGCYELTNENYVNVFYKNNYAAQVMYQNLYMTYGGTNWGNLAEPGVYTSYDYGAAIREDRRLTSKYNELKLQAYFLHASRSFLTAEIVSTTNITDSGSVDPSGTGATDGSDVFVTGMSSADGGGFYVVRQVTNNITSPTHFALDVNTTIGELTIPRLGGSVTLAGRESKILPTDYAFGSSILDYSTAEVLTWFTSDGTDFIMLYAFEGQDIEVSLKTAITSASVTGTSFNTTYLDGSLIVSGSPSGLTRVDVGNDTTLLIVDKVSAYGLWAPRLVGDNNTTTYDQSPDTSSALVTGPYLVRNATLEGTTLALYGDLNATTTISVLAPSNITSFTWNGAQVDANIDDFGFLSGSVSINVTEVQLPDLRGAEWWVIDSLPEVQDDFDDSEWVTANLTSAKSPYQPYNGTYVLYADFYGFHQGNTIYRGHFNGTGASGVELSVQGGQNFSYGAWINDRYLGSNPPGGADTSNDTWIFEEGDLKEGDNVVTIVLDPTGQEEWYPGDRFKTPRGLRGYGLLGDVDFDHWKIAGNLGGEHWPDAVRGPMNEGGLYVERLGAHLPAFPISDFNWTAPSNTSSPFVGIDGAGISAYRTNFTLNIPSDVDAPISLNFTYTPGSNYRSIIYVNGWQFGRFSALTGPQSLFPIPQGIMNHQGENELLVTLWSLDSDGAKIEGLELVHTALVVSSKEGFVNGVVESPDYFTLRT